MICLTSINTVCNSSKLSQKNKLLRKKGGPSPPRPPLNPPLPITDSNNFTLQDSLVTLFKIAILFLALSYYERFSLMRSFFTGEQNCS